MKIKFCPICAIVSLLWLTLSAGVAWGFLMPDVFLIPVALLMGGTVVGITYLGEKRCLWAARYPQMWKILVTSIGMPLAYLMVTNLNKSIVLIEISLMLIIAYFFFIKQSSKKMIGGSKNLLPQENISKIEEQMEHCC